MTRNETIAGQLYASLRHFGFDEPDAREIAADMLTRMELADSRREASAQIAALAMIQGMARAS